MTILKLKKLRGKKVIWIGNFQEVKEFLACVFKANDTKDL